MKKGLLRRSEQLVENENIAVLIFLAQLHLNLPDFMGHSLILLLIQTPRWSTFGYRCYLDFMDNSPMSNPSSPLSLHLLQQLGSHHPSPLATAVVHPQDVLVVICSSSCCIPYLQLSRLWPDCIHLALSRMRRCLLSAAGPSGSAGRRCSGWLRAGCMYTRCCRHVCYFVPLVRMSKLWTVCWNGWKMALCNGNSRGHTKSAVTRSLRHHSSWKLTPTSIFSVGKI